MCRVPRRGRRATIPCCSTPPPGPPPHPPSSNCSAREGKAVDWKCKGPRFDSRGAPEGFSHT
eukprot:6352252-Prymnesium_polylepis.1